MQYLPHVHMMGSLAFFTFCSQCFCISLPLLACSFCLLLSSYFLEVLAVEGTLSLLYAKLPSEDSGFKWLFHTLGGSVPE